MGSGKTMLVSEMAQAVLKEDAPVCIEAFDGSIHRGGRARHNTAARSARASGNVRQ